MKKIFLLMFAAAAALGSWADDAVTAKYNGAKLDVELTNTTAFVAFQMDIDLPEGVTVSSITSNLDRLKQGDNVTIGGAETETPFEVIYNVIDATNNVVRVVAYNLGNHEILGESGKLFTLNLSADVTEASIDNILFVDNALVEQAIEKAVAEKGGGILGDVNGDGSVTALDATCVYNAVVGLWSAGNADVNGDGSVTVLDATMVYNIIVGNY